MKYIFSAIAEKTKDDGLLRVRIRIKWNNSKSVASFSIPYLVDATKWIKEMQRVKPNTTHGKAKVMASTINRLIDKYEDIVQFIFSEAQAQNKDIEVDYLKAEINREIKGKDAPTNSERIDDLFDLFIRHKAKEKGLELSTIEVIKSYNKNILSFKEDMTTKDLNKAFVGSLYDYIIYNYKSSTAKKIITIFRDFLKFLIKNKHIEDSDILEDAPTVKSIDKKIIFLTWEELITFYNYPTKREYEQIAKDIFCLASFTSLRYSDIKNLNIANIKDNKIELIIQKTRKTIHIELNDYAKEILSRQTPDLTTGKIFKYISVPTLNTNIKSIAKACKIDEAIEIEYYKHRRRIKEIKPKYELISIHTGRKTFVSNAIMMGIDPYIVMKWTGHSDYKTMKPYIDISNEAKAKAMDLFNKKKQSEILDFRTKF